MISLNDGKDWLVVTPEGLFDGSPDGRKILSYRIGDGLNVVGADRFLEACHHPGLLAAVWRGERPVPKVMPPAEDR